MPGPGPPRKRPKAKPCGVKRLLRRSGDSADGVGQKRKSADGVGQKRKLADGVGGKKIARGKSAMGQNTSADRVQNKSTDGSVWRRSCTQWMFEPQGLSDDDIQQICTYLLGKKGRMISTIESSGAGLFFHFHEAVPLRTLWNFLNYHSKGSRHQGFQSCEWKFSAHQDGDAMVTQEGKAEAEESNSTVGADGAPLGPPPCRQEEHRAEMPQESSTGSKGQEEQISSAQGSAPHREQISSAEGSAPHRHSFVAYGFWRRAGLEPQQMKAEWAKCYQAMPEADYPPIQDGTFGEVKFMRRLRDGEVVIAKIARDKIPSRDVNQEVLLLELFDHPNVIKLLDWWSVEAKNILIFQHAGKSLRSLQKRSFSLLPKANLQSIMQQLLSALAHIHARMVIHNDISAANVMVDEVSNRVCLIDFGNSVPCLSEFKPEVQCKQGSSVQEVTLWFRPPELLLGFDEPDFSIDVWSSGVLFGHLILGQAMFPGSTEIDMIMSIFAFFGRPSSDFWRQLPLWSENFPNFPSRELPAIFEDRVGADGVALFRAMCCLDRSGRAPAGELSRHRFCMQADTPTAKALARPLGSEDGGASKHSPNIKVSLHSQVDEVPGTRAYPPGPEQEGAADAATFVGSSGLEESRDKKVATDTSGLLEVI